MSDKQQEMFQRFKEHHTESKPLAERIAYVKSVANNQIKVQAPLAQYW